jgi:hypothetical protein
MAKDITPRSLRCGPGQCPGIFEMADGRVAIRGNVLSVDDEAELEAFGTGQGENYTVLPAQYAGLIELWNALESEGPGKGGGS